MAARGYGKLRKKDEYLGQDEENFSQIGGVWRDARRGFNLAQILKNPEAARHLPGAERYLAAQAALLDQRFSSSAR